MSNLARDAALMTRAMEDHERHSLEGPFSSDVPWDILLLDFRREEAL